MLCDRKLYLVQRVLWEVGGNLAIGPPTLSRQTNRTQVLADRLEEAALYDRAGARLPCQCRCQMCCDRV